MSTVVTQWFDGDVTCCFRLRVFLQVTPLEGRSERLAKGDEVLAVYVDTTSFYHATIAIPPRGRGAQIVRMLCVCVSYLPCGTRIGVAPDFLSRMTEKN